MISEKYDILISFVAISFCQALMLFGIWTSAFSNKIKFSGWCLMVKTFKNFKVVYWWFWKSIRKSPVMNIFNKVITCEGKNLGILLIASILVRQIPWRWRCAAQKSMHLEILESPYIKKNRFSRPGKCWNSDAGPGKSWKSELAYIFLMRWIHWSF